jgi:hypothetical protein
MKDSEGVLGGVTRPKIQFEVPTPIRLDSAGYFVLGKLEDDEFALSRAAAV